MTQDRHHRTVKRFQLMQGIQVCFFSLPPWPHHFLLCLPTFHFISYGSYFNSLRGVVALNTIETFILKNRKDLLLFMMK